MNIVKVKYILANTLRRNPRLRATYILARNVNDEAFIKRLSQYDADVQTVYYEKYGEDYKGKPFGLITNGGKSGFFSVFNCTLMQLYYCYLNNLIPIIKWSEDWIYSEKTKINNTYNPWEYYFDRCSEYSVEDIKTASRVAIIDERMAFAILRDLGGNSYMYGKQLMEAMALSLRKWVRLNESAKSKIDKDLPKCIFDEKTLGVHIRGGGMLAGAFNHPKVPRIEEYVDAIEDAYSNGRYKKIFLATDDNNALKDLINYFGNQILIYYRDVARAEGEYDNYMAPNDRKYNNYLNGYEVLRDAYTLAACNGILSGLSSVAIAARVIRMSEMKKFSDDITIDKGLHTTGEDSQKLKSQMEGKFR